LKHSPATSALGFFKRHESKFIIGLKTQLVSMLNSGYYTIYMQRIPKMIGPFGVAGGVHSSCETIGLNTA
jgi:hypothetical protein